MSLELAIERNTAAIEALIAIWNAQQAAKPAVETPKVETKKPVAVVAIQETVPAQETIVKESHSEPVKEMTYDDIRVPFVALAGKKGTGAVTSLLAQFGVDATKGGKLSAIDKAQWPAVLEAIQKAMA